MIARRDFIDGLANGLAVLESFDTERQRLNATLAAGRAGLTRAAARRHLLTLAELGYLESEDGWFRLSPKVLRLAGSYLASARLPRLLQPALDRLALQAGGSASAVVLDGAQVVIVARSVGLVASHPDRPARAGHRSGAPLLADGLHQGARLPAYATSTGRMLLACMAPRDFTAWLNAQPPLQRRTAYTATDTRTLRALVAQARRDDHCIASQEHELGVQALAVPVRDREGRAVAAINLVAAPEPLSPDALQRDLLPLLRQAAADVQALL